MGNIYQMLKKNLSLRVAQEIELFSCWKPEHETNVASKSFYNLSAHFEIVKKLFYQINCKTTTASPEKQKKPEKLEPAQPEEALVRHSCSSGLQLL